MGTPNQEFTLPELPHHGDHDARIWSELALSGVILRAYTNAMWTRSRLVDIIANSMPYVPPVPEVATVETPRAQTEAARWTGSRLTDAQVIPGPDRRPQPQTVAERIQHATPIIVPRPATGPYWSGSIAAREAAAAYVPDRLSPTDEQASRNEVERLLAEVNQYRDRAGMPVSHTVEAETVAPVVAAEPVMQSAPMRQVEQQLPADDMSALHFNGKPVDTLLEEIGYLHDEQESN
jgi:hypothetical protein